PSALRHRRRLHTATRIGRRAGCVPGGARSLYAGRPRGVATPAGRPSAHDLTQRRSGLRQFRLDRLRQLLSLWLVAGTECAGDSPVTPYQHLVEVPARLPSALRMHPGIEWRSFRATHMRYPGHREFHTEGRLAERLHSLVVGRLLVEVLRR